MEKISRKIKIIGILGGMGPQASAELYQLLIQKSVKFYHVQSNDEFPEILIDSVPVPDFISNTKYLPTARRMLVDRIESMNNYSVDYIGIACNTAHILLPYLRKVTTVPIISLIEEIKQMVKEEDCRRVGLLATMTTYQSGLYDSVRNRTVQLIIPDNAIQQDVEDIIRGVIGGESLNKLQKKAREVFDGFIRQNKVDTIILGCTELPLIFPKYKNIRLLSSLDVLADSLLKRYFGGNHGPVIN
jgi:aspartate racemase